MSSSGRVSSLLLTQGLPLLNRATQNPYAATGTWIFGTAGLVVSMIHIGGMTRLTQSGLSMTSWTPLGGLPPMSMREWQEEFDRYKKFPEWQQRQSMTLSEFQFIYAWEYGHRMLGRVVGVAFVLPWMYFSIRGKIPKGYQPKMIGLLAMGGSQGLVGWWMVQSGLGEDRRNDTREIRVKPVRLATHLGMAVATYGALLWTGLDLWSLPHQSTLATQIQSVQHDTMRHAARLRRGSLALTGLTFVTVLSGALVAGNDAGRAFNTWPKMGDEWIPSEIFEDMSTTTNTATTVPHWQRQLVEHTATVQFNHRLLGYITAVSALTLAAIGLHKPTLVTPQVRQGLYAVGVAASAQMALGVTTLLYYVPLSLAALHQLGSVVVFTSGVYLTHALRYAGTSTNSMVRKAAKNVVSSAAKTVAQA